MNDDGRQRLKAHAYDIIREPLNDFISTKISFNETSTGLTLEEAIEPLSTLLPNLLTFVKLAKEKCQNPQDGLTTDESAAIMLYSMDWPPMEECFQYVLNETLRTKDKTRLDPWSLYLALLFRALSHLPTVSAIVYRPIELDLSEQYPLQRRFTWCSFALCRCSMKDDEYWRNSSNKRTLFRIHTQSAKNIQHHTFHPNEDQILLLDGSQFQVTSSSLINDQEYRIDLREISSLSCSVSRRGSLCNASTPLPPEQVLTQSNVDSLESKFESIDKYISRTWKLQQKIDHAPSYSSINLTNEQLDDQDISFIIQHAIVKKQCSILRLDHNHLTYKATTILAPALEKNQTLIGLNLSSNQISDKGIVPFVRLLSLNYFKLQKLHLGANQISNEGALLLANILQTNQTLTVLWLDSNRIGNEGVHYLSNALIRHNRTLQDLSLKNNRFITPISCRFLLDLIRNNRTLIELDISQCSLTKKENLLLIDQARLCPSLRLKTDREPDECIIA